MSERRRFGGEWKTRRIDALAEVDPESLPSSTGPGFAFSYISLDDVDAGRLLGYSRESFATAPSRARRVVRDGDVLMSTVRPALQGHLLFGGQVPNAICSTGFAVLRTKRSEGDSRFLFAHLLGDVVAAQVQSLLAGSNYPAINTGDVGGLRVTCPPTLTEQRAIAAVLMDVDALIGSLEALIGKKRAIKRAAMQQLLTGGMRLPGFSGEWETRRLGECVRIRGDRVSPREANGRHAMCVELEDIEQATGRLLNREPAGSVSAKYSFETGDVLFGRLRPYLRKWWFADRPGVCSTEIWPLVSDPTRAENRFVYWLIQADALHEAAQVSYGTHMPRADWRVIAEVPLSLPPLTEQRAIAVVLTDMDAEIAALERRLDKTRAVKQGMMQQLLTGAIRLPIPANGLEDEAHDA